MPTLYVVNGKPASCGKCAHRVKQAHYLPKCWGPCKARDCGNCDKFHYVVARYGYCPVRDTCRAAKAKPCESYKEEVS